MSEFSLEIFFLINSGGTSMQITYLNLLREFQNILNILFHFALLSLLQSKESVLLVQFLHASGSAWLTRFTDGPVSCLRHGHELSVMK